MNDEQVDAALAEIEAALVTDDPAFARRVRTARRRDTVNAVAVFVLLAVGAVLLTVGFATATFVPWSIGVASLFTAVFVDDHHRRGLR